jgi:hypothetical protein
MVKKVIQYHMFDWVTELYFSEILPKTFDHINYNNQILDTDRITPVQAGEENPHLKNYVALYDGEDLLNNISTMVTRKKGTMLNPVKIESVDDLITDYKKDRPNKHDMVRFYSHESKNMHHKYSKLINAYSKISEDDLIENGIPFDFMSYDGVSVPKYCMGSGSSAALVTTKKHPVGAVCIKKSEFLFGGKVVHFREGRLVEEIYAQGFNQETGELSIVHRKYNSIDDFEEIKTIRKYEVDKKYQFNNEQKSVRPLSFSETNYPYEIFPIGGDSSAFADSHFA